MSFSDELRAFAKKTTGLSDLVVKRVVAGVAESLADIAHYSGRK